ncbi:tetratricopeptide repeat protein [Fodinibius sp.]|uniref:tetratricopeptide repeat protein n=1 Tax=Fodinibius sp. TaxID=1872440 RepID=UPI002ACE2089|nr:tetratricopeptide repeat protein [Fodinibius sp.]MDZ7660699.1 tetratricopeptide repeat protein [Fodinibius sp.]
MFIKKLPHLLVTLLTVILIGCGSSNPLADEAQNNLKNQDFEAAIASAEKSIEQYPGDPLGYYYKAVALGELARSQDDPTERADYYEQMNKAFETAKSVADTSENVPSKINNISGVKVAIWQTEFQRGIDLATNDSVMSTVDNPMKLSMQHLKNATKVLPDSASSWNVYAQISARNKEFEEAVSAKDKYMNMIPESEIDTVDYLHLGNYYYNLDKHDKVVEVFEEGQERYPGSERIASALADAYGRVGEDEKAIATLNKLVEQDPKNPQYRLVMGTKLYQQALRIRDSLNTNSQEIMKLQKQFNQADQSDKEEIKSKIESLSSENEKLMKEMNELTKRAEEEIKVALEYRPNDPAAYETLGVIYQNKAKTYFDRRNRTTDNKEAARLDKVGKENIRQAMKYYEKAVELDPDNKNYWRSLFQIYTFLGMDEKAKEAMEKAGMKE